MTFPLLHEQTSIGLVVFLIILYLLLKYISNKFHPSLSLLLLLFLISGSVYLYKTYLIPADYKTIVFNDRFYYIANEDLLIFNTEPDTITFQLPPESDVINREVFLTYKNSKGEVIQDNISMTFEFQWLEQKFLLEELLMIKDSNKGKSFNHESYVDKLIIPYFKKELKKELELYEKADKPITEERYKEAFKMAYLNTLEKFSLTFTHAYSMKLNYKVL